MTLHKNRHRHSLSKKVTEIHAAVIELSPGIWTRMLQLAPIELENFINNEPHEIGEPRYFAHLLKDKQIVVFPKPDKPYTCKVLGSIFFE